jgi:lipid-A-disaccharide synthase
MGPLGGERSVRLLISAGEASGDMHGAALLGALRRLAGSVLPSATPGEAGEFGGLAGRIECFGLGGERLRAAGCETVIDAKEVAVLGLAEVVSHLPRVYREFRRLLKEVDRRRPDAAVLIDFPEFNFRLARQLHRRGIPVIYYISPQLWAWRKGRVKLVQRYVRKMLVIFPFEREFYRRHGVEVKFVGHPLADVADASASGSVIKRDSRQITLLPGSRRKEIELNLPAMLAAAARVHARHPELHFSLPVASTISRVWLEELIGRLRPGTAATFPLELVADAQQALASSQAAVVASGTATLEAALAGTPLVMVYRLTVLTWLLGRRLVDVPFFCIVNLIAGREVVPELVQRDFTPINVANRIERVLADGPERQQMLDGLREVRARLSVAVGASASETAAREILKIIQLEWRAKAQAAQSCSIK